MKRFIVLTALMLAGCATQQPVVWYKDGATEEQFRRDQIQCRQYGMQSAQANGLAGNIFVESWISREAASCLQSLGYNASSKRQDPEKAIEHLQLPKIDQSQKGLHF